MAILALLYRALETSEPTGEAELEDLGGRDAAPSSALWHGLRGDGSGPRPRPRQAPARPEQPPCAGAQRGACGGGAGDDARDPQLQRAAGGSEPGSP